MKGICKLSCIPVRKEASSTAEMTTMLLFGETYSIIESNDGWTFIKTDFDTYEGWISSKQADKLLAEPSQAAVSFGYPFNKATSGNESIFILPGSLLPDYRDGSFNLNHQEYALDLPNIGYSKTDLIYVAKQFLNAPYLWGGRSPFGIDCSGFTQIVYRICGFALPRDAWQQAENGTTLGFREEAKAGDLAFFDNEEGRITHVGMMLNPDEIIHASGRVRIDKIDGHGIFDAEREEYSHKLRIIKRISV